MILEESKKFEVRLDPDAVKEYLKIDNSVIKIVDKAIDDLEYRADVVGTILRNNSSTKLAGCKEKKLREAGIRIVFKVTEDRVDILRIVYILTIEKRSNDSVFKIAHKRNITIKNFSEEQLHSYLRDCKNWTAIDEDNDD